MLSSLNPTHQNLSTAKYIHSQRRTSKHYENGWMRRLRGTFGCLHHQLHCPFSKFPRKTGNYPLYRTTTSSTVTQSKTMLPYPILKSPYQLWPTHSFFPLLTFDGDITTSIYTMAINGKLHSRHVLASGNPWSCTSGTPTPLPPSR